MGIPGMASLRLVSKIRQREFVEMGELLPEFWGAGREETGERREEPRARRRSQKVSDINTWLQCFATYVAVLGPHDSPMIPRDDGLPGAHCPSQPGF